MSPNPPPPPPRNAAASASTSSSSDAEASRWTRWGKTAFNKSIVVSDWASGYANSASAKIGGERFWPKSNDFPEEIAKCERILRAFTVEGIETKPSPSSSPSTSPNAELEHDNSVDEKQKKKQESFIHKKRKVLRKIPPAVIKRAKGIVIYTAMRSGIAPLGGAGGAGLMLARLPDGSWSAPSAISPNNIAVGLLLGFDIFDVILIVNTEQAMESFKSHKVTLGAETAVAAGPFGTGISAEMGIDRIPVFSYVRSRGLYGGVEAMAQAFLHRFDENERIYYWPGVTARDILEGKARKPPLMDPLYRALRDAETGIAQGDSLETKIYEVVNAPPNVAVRQLQKEENAQLLQDGERLRLPPTPEELMAMEEAGIPDEIDLELERKVKEEAERRAIEEKKEIMALPPPPTHKKVLSYWESRGTIPGGKRRVAPAPSPLQNKAHVGGGEKEDNEELEVVDLNEAKPSPPERRPQSVESLARELEGSSLDTDGAFEDTYSTDPPSYEHTSPPTSPIYGHAEKSTTITTNSPTSLPDGVLGQSKSDSEHIPLVVIEPVTQTITSTCTHDPLASALPADLNAESLSRTSSLDRPSRPPRRGVPPHSPLLATATNTQTSDFETPKPKLKLFFDWDETVTTHDTLSLIAPPEGNQLDGPSFSYYKQEYVSDLSKFEETFGTKETWDQQLAFLVAIDSVEMASLNRVEQGGLFRGMSKTELIKRAETEVQFRDGWDDFYTWLKNETKEGRVDGGEVISVSWSGEFIRSAIRARALETDDIVIRVYANEVEMNHGEQEGEEEEEEGGGGGGGISDQRSTGKLTKSSPLDLLQINHQNKNNNENKDGATTEATGIRTGIHKLQIMQTLTTLSHQQIVSVYIGDSATDLPCLLKASFGLIMKPSHEFFQNSSIHKIIQTTNPPIRSFYKHANEFLSSHSNTLNHNHIQNEQEGKEGAGGVLIRVDDWTQALQVIQKIQYFISSSL